MINHQNYQFEWLACVEKTKTAFVYVTNIFLCVFGGNHNDSAVDFNELLSYQRKNEIQCE